MNKKQFFVYAVFVGAQSFLLQLIDQLIGFDLVSGGNKGFVFLAFQSWALYFLMGCNMKGAIKASAGYVLGIAFAIVMLIIPELLPAIGIFCVPVTALVVVPFMMYFEFAHWTVNSVSVFFMGSGAFFGVYNYVKDITLWEAIAVVMLYCILGLGSGFISILFRNWYEKKLVKEIEV